MKTSKTDLNQVCPKCGIVGNQKKGGFSSAGTQRYICKHCKGSYSLDPKTRAYSEEIRETAMKVYCSGVSGRGVGKVFGMSKANIYNWIKKNRDCVDK